MLYDVQLLCHTCHNYQGGHTNYRICDHCDQCGHYSTMVRHAIIGVTTVPQLSNWSQWLDVCEFSAKYSKVATQSINTSKSTDMHGQTYSKSFSYGE